VIAGGGTGGHVIPAIAIGQALAAGGRDPARIWFVGSTRGMEGRMVPAAGFPVVLLPGRGVARRLTWDNVGALAGLAAAFCRSAVLLRRWRPEVVVSVGGYASAPAALAAVLWRIPLVLAEQNTVPGLANRMVGRFARAAAVSFPGTPLPRAEVTGNPIREQMRHVDRSPAGRAAARAALGYDPDGVLVAVAGGSLGSRRINDAAVGLATQWACRPRTAVHHVVGERDSDELARIAPTPVPGGLVYRQVRFEDHMDAVYAAADIAVQRAGASTVFELAAAGLPSVLVPLPGAPGDHQRLNAERMAAAGAAVVVPDGDLDTARLARELDRLLAAPAALAAMGEAARAMAAPDAAARVAAVVEAHAGG
jgi:UDP-N-acetylglucosamine--N-acetylmuramyl-(pentapeptide) pyrophosphoryl-undecaprenol N-acetylglucosamine transferase